MTDFLCIVKHLKQRAVSKKLLSRNYIVRVSLGDRKHVKSKYFYFWKKQLFRWRACDWNTIIAARNQLGTVTSKSLSLSEGESDSFRVRCLSSDRVIAMLEARDNVKLRWTEVSELTFFRNITWLTTSKFLFIMSVVGICLISFYLFAHFGLILW